MPSSETPREGVGREAETGARGPQAQEDKSGRGKDSPLESLPPPPRKQGSPAGLQTSGLQNCETVHFCCLYHQVCGCFLGGLGKRAQGVLPLLLGIPLGCGLWGPGSTAPRHDTAAANGTRGRQPSHQGSSIVGTQAVVRALGALPGQQATQQLTLSQHQKIV